MERRMSRKERDRLTILRPLAEGRLTRVAAGRLLGLSVRQVRRILLRHRAEGDAGLVHRARERPSNRRMPEATARRAVALVKARYRDFGPTWRDGTLPAVFLALRRRLNGKIQRPAPAGEGLADLPNRDIIW